MLDILAHDRAAVLVDLHRHFNRIFLRLRVLSRESPELAARLGRVWRHVERAEAGVSRELDKLKG